MSYVRNEHCVQVNVQLISGLFPEENSPSIEISLQGFAGYMKPAF